MGYIAKVISRTQVQIRDSRTGNYVCTCTTVTQSPIVSAYVSGDEVIVNLADGRVEVHSARTGNQISGAR